MLWTVLCLHSFALSVLKFFVYISIFLFFLVKMTIEPVLTEIVAVNTLLMLRGASIVGLLEYIVMMIIE